MSKAVDTRELEERWKGLKITNPFKEELAGRKEVHEVVEEGGLGEIQAEQDIIPGGWEWIWLQDPWMEKMEQVRVPKAEVEDQRKKGLLQKPSYWVESKTREWRRKIREQKEAITREKEARRERYLEELRKMGCFLDLGVTRQERGTRPGDGWEKKRPSRF